MTLNELLEATSWPDIKAALLWAYPDSKQSLDGYRLAVAKLRRLPTKPSNMRISVKETVREGIDEEPFMDVFGRNGQRNREQSDFQYFADRVDEAYAKAETQFGLCLRPWAEWLGMEIEQATLDALPASQILAHCLWEMTFHGFEEWQVQEMSDELKRRVDELDAMSEQERQEQLVPHEELFKHLRSRLDDPGD